MRDWSCTWFLVSSSRPRAWSRTSAATCFASSLATLAACLAWSVVDPWSFVVVAVGSVGPGTVDVLMELVVMPYLPLGVC